jgi:adenylate kinase family enzyme
MKVNIFTRRFILVIYNLGKINNDNLKFINSKSRLVKFYDLLVKPKILDKLLESFSLEILNFGINFEETKDTIFRHLHGAYLVNFADKISESLHKKLIKQNKEGNAYHYILQKSGEYIATQIMEENNEESQYYQEIFKKMLPLKIKATQEIVKNFNKIIKKENKLIGIRL